MIRTILIAGLVWLVVGFNVATAEIYKYRDTHGVIRYTYDLAEVPEEQRPKVQTYEETPAATPEVDPAPKEDDAVAGTVEDDSGKGTPVVDEKKIEELNQRKKELDAELAGLMEEKYKLLKEKENLKGSLAGRDANRVAEYDGKVKKLNRKIAEYEKRLEAFQKEVDEVQKALGSPEESGS